MIENDYLPTYGPQGLSAFVVHAGMNTPFAVSLTAKNALTFSLILDTDETVFDVFSQTTPTSLPFPLGYLVDRKGIIRHIYSGYVEGEISPPTLTDDITALLAE